MIEDTFSNPIAWALFQSNESSAGIQARAEEVLAQHEESAGIYLQMLDAPNPYPFESLPPGSQTRDLVNGGQLILFADGSSLVVTPDPRFRFLGNDGICSELTLQLGKVHLPDGLELTLLPGLDPTTHTFEQLGIEGLPAGVLPQRIAEQRFAFDLPDGHRMLLDHGLNLITLITPEGALVFLGAERMESVGEPMENRIISGGGMSFGTSSVRGLIQADGTVHLSVGDSDLVILLPGVFGEGVDDTVPYLKECLDV